MSINKSISYLLWGPIDPMCSNCIGRGRAQYLVLYDRLYKKGPGPISSPRIREYPRTTSKGGDESYTPRRSKECL